MEMSVSSRQKISNPDDMFTFPNTKNDDDHESDQNFEFKFEFASSDSPGSPYKDSPADHLFCNGVMLPHSFPAQPMYCYYYGSERRSYQRSTSRTNSIGSKDSFLSSRSSSTNSRSSSCSSSARTSLSDSSERTLFYQNNAMRRYHLKKAQKHPVLDQVYGSSRRWQFITPVPVMSQETSRPHIAKPKLNATANKKNDTNKKGGSWFGLRFFHYFLSVCKECHAIEPSVRRRNTTIHGNENI